MRNVLSGRVIMAALALLLFTATGLAAVNAKAQPRGGNVVCSGVPNNVGLAMDSRRNLYTADRETGRVYCLPPDHPPILYAEIPGTPIALAVDKLRNVFVGTDDGRIYMISLDGAVSEAYRFGTPPVGLEVDRDGTLMVATGDGAIIKVDRKEFYSN